MPGVRHDATGLYPHINGTRPGKVYRGSRKRIQRIKWRENTSVEFWILVILLLFMLLVAIPWLIKHPIEHHHEQSGNVTPNPDTVYARPTRTASLFLEV
jgi:hypothetical protein